MGLVLQASPTSCTNLSLILEHGTFCIPICSAAEVGAALDKVVADG